MRLLVSRMFQRTILACRCLKTAPITSAVYLASPSSREEVRLDLRLDGVDGGVAGSLFGDLVGGAQFGFGKLQHFGFERGIDLPARIRAAPWQQLRQA